MYGMWTAFRCCARMAAAPSSTWRRWWANAALPLQNFYSATKFAIIGLTEAVRVELETEKENIALCAICPPSVDTPFYDNALSKMGNCSKPLPIVLLGGPVARDIVRCAVRARREVWVGLIGKAFVTLSILFPWMMDRYVTSLGYKAQMTDEPTGEAALLRAYAADRRERRLVGVGKERTRRQQVTVEGG